VAKLSPWEEDGGFTPPVAKAGHKGPIMLNAWPEVQTELARTIHSRAQKRWGEAMVMVGTHPKFTAVLERLARFADSESAVLITGETGTGKELFARALYLLSRRDGAAFHSVNCAQYHDGQLVASELFGHKKGSFTGAMTDHVGLFEAAQGGMVFLDEVTELSAPAQAMLLRALGEGEIVPVGETRPRRVQVRVVAAGAGDIPALVQAGRFRADLYYRLRGLHLQVPPVRERGRDWELIRDYYLHRLGGVHACEKQFSTESDDILRRYDWPGNVREIKSLVETGYCLSDNGTIEPRHFLDALEEAARLGQLRKVPLCDPETRCFDQMIEERGCFWDVVHQPYMDRELSRTQVRNIVARGLDSSKGSYKKLLALFGIPESDYLRFMDFLRHHRLKPEG
jgi:DNA-binding NtrC family response regulator